VIQLTTQGFWPPDLHGRAEASQRLQTMATRASRQAILRAQSIAAYVEKKMSMDIAGEAAFNIARLLILLFGECEIDFIAIQ
jgi:hypothetical protein